MDFNGLKQIGWQDAGAIAAMSMLVVGFFAWICKKIFGFGKLLQRIDNVELSIKEDLKPELQLLGQRIHELALCINSSSLTSSNSPRVLNTRGRKILDDSRVSEIIEERFEDIVSKVREMQPENEYQAERATIDIVQDMANDPYSKDQLESGAFNSGSSVGMVLFVAAINIRDRVIKQLGLTPEEAHNT
jgi:hypothetical protein